MIEGAPARRSRGSVGRVRLALLAALAQSVFLLAAGCGLLGSSVSAPTLQGASLDGVVAGVVIGEDVVWATVNRVDGAYLVGVDPVSGEVTSSRHLGSGEALGEARLVDGFVYQRFAGEPIDGAELHQLERQFEDEGDRADLVQLLLKIDPVSGSVQRQYEYVGGASQSRSQPLIVTDGLFFSPVGSFRTVIDLDSGEGFWSGGPNPPARHWQVEDGTVWFGGGDEVVQVDLETGETLQLIRNMNPSQFSFVSYYEDRYWLVDFDRTVDRQTIHEFVPAGEPDQWGTRAGVAGEAWTGSEFPIRWWEWGPYRWEQLSDGGFSDDRENPVWRQVDVGSGDGPSGAVVAEFNFGVFRPVAGDANAVWLVGSVGASDELARLALS